MAKKSCQMGWIVCSILQIAKKAIVRFQILAIPSKSEHKKRCQLLDRLFEVFQHSKNMQCFGHFWTLLDTFGHFWTLLPHKRDYVIYGWYLARWIGLRGSRVRLVSTPRSDIGELGGDPVQDPSRPPLWPPPWPPWPSWGSRSHSFPPPPRPVVAAIFKKTWNKN